MKAKTLPCINYLRECFYYNAETGLLVWKNRPESHFNSFNKYDSANLKKAGFEAGYQGSNGYRRVNLNGEIYLVHRISLMLATGKDPQNSFVDHINGIPSDNRMCNLRLATHTQNMRNRVNGAHKSSISGVRGVYKNKSGTYRSSYWLEGKRIHLGNFSTLKEAATLADQARKKIFGEFSGIKN
jgi:hypothetical protein